MKLSIKKGDTVTFTDTGVVCKVVKVNLDGSIELERVE